MTGLTVAARRVGPTPGVPERGAVGRGERTGQHHADRLPGPGVGRVEGRAGDQPDPGRAADRRVVADGGPGLDRVVRRPQTVLPGSLRGQRGRAGRIALGGPAGVDSPGQRAAGGDRRPLVSVPPAGISRHGGPLLLAGRPGSAADPRPVPRPPRAMDVGRPDPRDAL